MATKKTTKKKAAVEVTEWDMYGKDKVRAPKKTNPKRYAIACNASAKEYLANGGTMQVLAVACLAACNGNKTEAQAILVGAITAGEADARLYYTEVGNYVRWAEKHPEKTEHRTYAEAEKLAKSLS